MDFKVKENKAINEKYYYKKHKSGLDVYVYPKDFGTSYAAFATKFGSCEREFVTGGKHVVLPDGVAHFLEHKMFENPDGRDTFELYAKTGASANAYTSNEKTVYLFSAADNVYESLEILLSFVTEPYFTDKTVEKEQGIIGQEIKMYDDNPGWQLYFGMLSGLYHNNPVRIDIAGTTETIAKITPEILFDAYNTFYNLENMVLVVCGRVECDKVEEICDKILKFKDAPKTERIYPDEPKNVKSSVVTKKMQVATPLFSVGIKDNDCPKSGRELAVKKAEYEILLDLMFSKSAPFFTKMTKSGIIDDDFSIAYDGHETFGYCELSGSAKEPKAAYEEIKKEIAHYKETGFDDESFERIKRARYASLLHIFNSTEDIANDMISALFDGSDILDYPEICAAVTKENVEKRLREGFFEDNFTLSEIYPLD